MLGWLGNDSLSRCHFIQAGMYLQVWKSCKREGKSTCKWSGVGKSLVYSINSKKASENKAQGCRRWNQEAGQRQDPLRHVGWGRMFAFISYWMGSQWIAWEAKQYNICILKIWFQPLSFGVKNGSKETSWQALIDLKGTGSSGHELNAEYGQSWDICWR